MKGPNPASSEIPTEDSGYRQYKVAGKLEGKNTIISGGDSGIGRAVDILFAMEGANSFIAYLPEEEKDAQETKRKVETHRQKMLRPHSGPEVKGGMQTGWRRYRRENGGRQRPGEQCCILDDDQERLGFVRVGIMPLLHTISETNHTPGTNEFVLLILTSILTSSWPRTAFLI